MCRARKLSTAFLLSFLVVSPLALGTDTPAPVEVIDAPVAIPTWLIGPAQVHPVFPDGGRKIYPYRLQETLTDAKANRAYRAVRLKNDYVEVLVLPDIGGRLHGARDLTNGYRWLYWQPTIKPGLIALTGAWISGGIEWNFPHGHRPSCFMPVDYRVIRHEDGSATVWVGETEPIYRLRWLVGIALSPGSSRVRCDYRFVNPTDHRHSFMFWATAATHANIHCQAQYPGDVVTGHGKKTFWNWPVHEGVDLTWWKNVPNASSFFAVDNPSNWFGTFDHAARGGLVHVADHRVMPGKKLWTWGCGPSGRIWDVILSDGGGPYFEPQAGAFCDNQPDYHWIEPGEVKEAHDYWYPVRDTRGFHAATPDFAANTDLSEGKAFAGVYATSPRGDLRARLADRRTGAILVEETLSVAPDRPWTVEVPAPEGCEVYDLELILYGGDGDDGEGPGETGAPLLTCTRDRPRKIDLPDPLRQPGDPAAMNPDELALAGEWLHRFRRTEQALEYYEEALRRDPGDVRANLDLAFLDLEAGMWADALERLDRASERDPEPGRLHYGRGLALEGLGKMAAARDAFARAAYDGATACVAHRALARDALGRKDYRAALDHIGAAAARSGRFADLPALEAATRRRMGDLKGALAAADRTLGLDPMHFMGLEERVRILEALGADTKKSVAIRRGVIRGEAQNAIDLACAYLRAGLHPEAEDVLARAAGWNASIGAVGSALPMVGYLRGHIALLDGRADEARNRFREARACTAAGVCPHRLEELAALEAACAFDPGDGRARLYRGNLLYAKGRRAEGLALWREAARLEPDLVFAWRNAGYGALRLEGDLKKALGAYREAFRLDPSDARVLLELDRAADKAGVDYGVRMARLLDHSGTVASRDDLTARLVDLRLRRGTAEDLAAVREVLAGRHFHSWEGRYAIHHAWVEVNHALGNRALAEGRGEEALARYDDAYLYPANLEVAPRTPDFRAHVHWKRVKALDALGRIADARRLAADITKERYRKTHIGHYYQALAFRYLGEKHRSEVRLDGLEKEARKRLSGDFAHRGTPEIMGRYLLSKVLEARGDEEGAAREREVALKARPDVHRLVIREAQLDTAAAHQ